MDMATVTPPQSPNPTPGETVLGSRLLAAIKPPLLIDLGDTNYSNTQVLPTQYKLTKLHLITHKSQHPFIIIVRISAHYTPTLLFCSLLISKNALHILAVLSSGITLKIHSEVNRFPY